MEEALQKNNLNVGGNVLESHSLQYIVRGIGLLQSLEDIGEVVLKSEKGIPILVSDVAAIRSGHAARQGASFKDGKEEAVGGIVMMLRGEQQSRGRPADRRNSSPEINRERVLPLGLKIQPYYERTEIVMKSMGTVTEALLFGSLLVIFILYLFLRSFRGALIVILALPLSLLFTFMMMRIAGLSANLMSLGGLAISIGMIIDATIIQVENVQRHLSETAPGATKMTTVFKAVMEVRKPSIFGELIIALTFLPIIALQGIEGKMFRPLAFTVAIALFASLLLSLFVIPAFCYLFLVRTAAGKKNGVIESARRIYLPVLRWSLAHRLALLAFSAGLLGVSLLLLSRVGTEFIPIMDEGAFDMDMQYLPGIALPESLEMSRKIEERLMAFPEMETIVSRTGQTGIAIEASGRRKDRVRRDAQTAVPPGRRPARARSSWRKMRDSLADFPGMAFAFSQPIACRIDELVAGTRAQLIIKLFGEDLAVLKEKADEIAKILSGIKGTADLVVESVSGQPYLSIQSDRRKISRYGLNVEDVQMIVETAIGGKSVTNLYEGEKVFGIQLRIPEERRNSLEAIAGILVTSAQGKRIPLEPARRHLHLRGTGPRSAANRGSAASASSVTSPAAISAGSWPKPRKRSAATSNCRPDTIWRGAGSSRTSSGPCAPCRSSFPLRSG